MALGRDVTRGVQAPADVPVRRAELENRGAADLAMPAYATLGAAVDPSEFLPEADLAS